MLELVRDCIKLFDRCGLGYVKKRNKCPMLLCFMRRSDLSVVSPK